MHACAAAVSPLHIVTKPFVLQCLVTAPSDLSYDNVAQTSIFDVSYLGFTLHVDYSVDVRSTAFGDSA